MIRFWGQCYPINPPQNHRLYRKSDQSNQDLSEGGPVNRRKILGYTIKNFFEFN